MENLLDKFDECIDYIESSNDYKDYLRLNKELSNNDEIMQLITEIKKNQQKAVRKEYNKEDKSREEEIINNDLNILNSIPLYIEFLNKQKIVNDNFILIKEKLNKYFDGVIN